MPRKKPELPGHGEYDVLMHGQDIAIYADYTEVPSVHIILMGRYLPGCEAGDYHIKTVLPMGIWEALKEAPLRKSNHGRKPKKGKAGRSRDH